MPSGVNARAELTAQHADAKAVGMAPEEMALGGGCVRRVPTWQRLFELAYFWGLGGTSQALLTPDVVGHWPMFTCVRFFVEHGAIVVGVCVLLFGVGLRPWPGAVWRAWWVTLVMAVVMLGINALLRATVAPDANYMYLCGPPKKPSLYDYFGPWPWSLVTLVAVGTVVFTLLYAPYWIADRWRGRRVVTK